MSEVIANINNTYKIEFAYRNGQTVTFTKVRGQWYDNSGKETTPNKIIQYMNKVNKPCDVIFSTFDGEKIAVVMHGVKTAVCGKKYNCNNLLYQMDEAFRGMI